MSQLKVASWNVEWMDRLYEPSANASVQARKEQRLSNIATEIQRVDPDILCMLEGPKSDANIQDFCQRQLGNAWQAVTLPATESYAIKGQQWIWFLVKTQLAAQCTLQPPRIWQDFAGARWNVHYWGEFAVTKHSHYRHPQVLVLDWQGTRVEFIGLYLKSKCVHNGESDWDAGGARREDFLREAIKARIKLTTEATNVRAYIDRRFEQHPNPAIFVMGDLNDGPGREYIERTYLLFDLLANIQGDVFFAHKFLNHALFDFANDLRWSVRFDDFVEDVADRPLSIDHILFTQGLVDGSLPLRINAGAGMVEHEAHEFTNAGQTASVQTSDHRPVSVTIEL